MSFTCLVEQPGRWFFHPEIGSGRRFFLAAGPGWKEWIALWRHPADLYGGNILLLNRESSALQVCTVAEVCVYLMYRTPRRTINLYIIDLSLSLLFYFYCWNACRGVGIIRSRSQWTFESAVALSIHSIRQDSWTNCSHLEFDGSTGYWAAALI